MLLAPLILPLLTALLTGLLSGRRRMCTAVSLAGSGLMLGSAVGLMLLVSREGRQSLVAGDWPLPYGIELAADGLSAALVLLIALLAVSVLVFQWRWGRPAPPIVHPLLHGVLASAVAVSLAADLFNLYVWLELMLIAVLGLLTLGGGRAQAEAALKYFALSMLGTLLMLAAVGLIYGATGHLNFGALREAALDPETASALAVYSGLLVVALLLKAGAFPLFAWLPASYHTLPAPLLALVGGLLTKLAVYVLLRLLGEVFVVTPAAFFETLGWLAVVTMVSGVLGAAYHWDVRRILAFHIVSQIGYLLLGVALATPAAATATAFFLFHNILVKANLFLIAGLIWASARHYDLRRIGGLYPARPLLAGLFLLNAFALVGVPPTSGFWGKLLILQEAFVQGRFVWGGVALAVGLLTLYSMTKIWLEGFWKAHTESADNVGQTASLPWVPTAVVLALSAVILGIGLYPEPFIAYLGSAAEPFWAGRETP
jgi:multicomponent Na+:H+ antiporter subunit D